jgi:hypothetical protein
MQFWANSLHEYPELYSNLPTDVVAMEYGGIVSIRTTSNGVREKSFVLFRGAGVARFFQF